MTEKIEEAVLETGEYSVAVASVSSTGSSSSSTESGSTSEGGTYTPPEDTGTGSNSSSSTTEEGAQPDVEDTDTGTNSSSSTDEGTYEEPEDTDTGSEESTTDEDGVYEEAKDTSICINCCSTNCLCNVPELLCTLIENECLSCSQIETTCDGFYMSKKSLSEILKAFGINELIDDDTVLGCDQYFDDWYLYVVRGKSGDIYSLVKMREQETDGSNANGNGDNNDPGVTICFIPFDINILKNCLYNDSEANRAALYAEINRVVHLKDQSHDEALYQYFNNPASYASYHLAELYIQNVANSAENNYIYMPDKYFDILADIESYENVIAQLNGRTDSGSQISISQAQENIRILRRIPDFLESLNEKAGYTIFDGEKIIINSKDNLSDFEKYAILASHTGNVSFNSFAAEVKFHADWLEPNIIGIYERAIRADMAIGEEKESSFADQYYNLNSSIVQEQIEYHGEK